MKTILIINDYSTKARHAIRFALAIARMVRTNILVAYTIGLAKRIPVKVRAAHGFENSLASGHRPHFVDVLINGLYRDMLVLVNKHFHFEEIIGRYIADSLPQQITVPLLVFPY